MTDQPKLRRYEARTLGGGNDYRLEPEEYGPLCRDVDVEELEAENKRLRVYDAIGDNAFHANRRADRMFDELEHIKAENKRLRDAVTNTLGVHSDGNITDQATVLMATCKDCGKLVVGKEVDGD